MINIIKTLFYSFHSDKLTHTCLKLKLYPGRNELTYP